MKNKTRTLQKGVKYRIGSKFFYVIVNGKRSNFPIEELRTERPVVSEEAEQLYRLCVHSWDSNNFGFSDYGEEVENECKLLWNWENIGPDSIRQFLNRKGLLLSK